MKTDLMIKAIQVLRPNSEFVIYDAKYENIEWHKLEGSEPTMAELLVAVEQVKANQKAAEEKAQADKAAAQAKLAALGLTVDDLKALGL
jgi:hypothetical protein